MKCEAFRLGEITLNFDRKRIPLSAKQRAEKQGGYPYYGAQGIIDYVNDYIFDGTYLLIAEDGENLKSKKQNIAQIAKGKFWVNNHAHIVQTNELCNLLYLYYLINSMDLSGYITGSAQPKLSQANLNAVTLQLPSIHVQNKIVSILSSIDDKIELNNAINNNLEQQAQALYKAWFVDFSAFGGTAPNNWQTYHLADFLPVVTGKKNANVSSDQGKYPFFSCSQDYAWTDDYSFDGSAILVAGNGDFNVKFYSGKFEAYQRTYVLIPYEPKYTAWLFYAVQYHLSSITSTARGSVIKFITKGSLEDFKFVAPKVPLSLPVIYTLDTINRKIAENHEENIKLGALRDTLLPKLMSGELDVSDIDL